MRGEAILVRDGGELGAFLGRLPRSVRFLGASPGRRGEAFRSQSGMHVVAGMYEFEVVSGNAAYREGERFYLTQAQAQRAYPTAPLS